MCVSICLSIYKNKQKPKQQSIQDKDFEKNQSRKFLQMISIKGFYV